MTVSEMAEILARMTAEEKRQKIAEISKLCLR